MYETGTGVGVGLGVAVLLVSETLDGVSLGADVEAHPMRETMTTAAMTTYADRRMTALEIPVSSISPV
ncbi:hypothetical protein GCM10027416_18710 [Okibacterium endophyticum]